MEHTKGRNGKRQWNGNSRRGQEKHFKHEHPVIDEEKQEAIKALKMKTVECPMCHKPVTDLAGALADRETGVPVHFDCVLEKIRQSEHLLPDQKISYIGQGRFGVITYENPHDIRSFKIQRIIEWEKSDEKVEWRAEFAGLYSQIK